MLLLRTLVLGVGLSGSVSGCAQYVDLEAGFVHGWRAELVDQNWNEPAAVGNGWRVSAAYHFGGDTATHMSLGVAWSTIHWDQEFHVVDNPFSGNSPQSSLVYDRSGTMETRTGHVLLSPMLSVRLSRRIQLLVSADLGLNVQAVRHERSAGTIALADGEYHGGHEPPGINYVLVDSTYKDREEMNPYFFAAKIGLGYNISDHWCIRVYGSPWSGRFYFSNNGEPRPAYMRVHVGYRLFNPKR